MNKFIFIIGLFLIECTIVYSQNRVVYTFLDANSLKDSSSGFKYKRLILGDSIYREMGLFLRDTAGVYIFKKNNGRLFVKQNGRWELFFNNGKYVKIEWFFLEDVVYSIRWENTNLNDIDNLIYKFDLIPFGISRGPWGAPSFYFTYYDGVIAIRGEDFFLIRSDKTYLIRLFNIRYNDVFFPM